MNPKPNDLSSQNPQSQSPSLNELHPQETTHQSQTQPLLNEEEPIPEKIFQISQTPKPADNDAKKKNPQSSKPKDTNTYRNPSLNVSKAYTCAIPINNIYEQFDVQQLTYSIMKDYSALKISKDENFMERMKFDVYKRQLKEERVNKLLEQNKLKIEEDERIKAFNRLIEDANRRLEAQENLESMKNKLDEDIISPPTKKYNESEWKEIYKERFKKFQENVDKKNEEKIKEKQEKERLKEEEEVELCKVKKAPKEVIEKSSKRLYEESIKRRMKMEQKLRRINYENSPSKYKKTINSEPYNFISDEEDNNSNIINEEQRINERILAKNLNSNNNNNNNMRLKNKQFKKGKKTPVSEYNNKRFEMCNKQNINSKIGNSNNLNNQKRVVQQKENKNNLEPYYEEEEEEKDIPKPVTLENIIHIENKEKENIIERTAIGKLNNIEENEKEENIYPKSQNLFRKEENDNNMKIVEHFFSKGYKH